ncbi:Zinc finger matrin-type protein 4 [Triplophysa tibetana]|uniref:Zinc finger matrin-type protein 4 n=2 Tax=Cypriniformes TaxID=7952 RepID=A0A5A9P8K3_9TELE|nr:Zinc finger matrin-type protein 4 [Triplophysa tibetana]
MNRSARLWVGGWFIPGTKSTGHSLESPSEGNRERDCVCDNLSPSLHLELFLWDSDAPTPSTCQSNFNGLLDILGPFSLSVSHSKKHANKVRLFYMLHPEDGGPPSKRLRPDNPDSAENEVDRNKCCTLCNMFFTSAIVAQSHYQGKTHAKRVRLVLGETPSLPTPTDSAPPTPQPTDPPTDPPPPSWSPLANHGEAGKYCCLCGAWFNNPLMAQQHYEGKKHKRNAARARLLEQLAGSLDANESTGLRRSYSCSVCKVVLNSIEQYHAHLQGSKHQNK